MCEGTACFRVVIPWLDAVACREGRLPLLLSHALVVAAHVFTDTPLPISYDRLMLTGGRECHRALTQRIHDECYAQVAVKP